MTRINCVSPSRLTDQHLLAEYRELPRVIFAAQRLWQEVARGEKPMPKDLPKTYRMGAGHVRFFYDKVDWLTNRQSRIIDDLVLRGYNLTHLRAPQVVVPSMRPWQPTQADIDTNLSRLRERFLDKPNYYTYHDEPVPDTWYTSTEGIA